MKYEARKSQIQQNSAVMQPVIAPSFQNPTASSSVTSVAVQPVVVSSLPVNDPSPLDDYMVGIENFVKTCVNVYF